MPERQATPGEATERPAADDTNGYGNGAAPPAPPQGGLAGQVAEQVAAEPDAAEPAAAEPGDGPPAADEPIVTGETAVDAAAPVTPARAEPSLFEPPPRPQPAPDVAATAPAPRSDAPAGIPATPAAAGAPQQGAPERGGSPAQGAVPAATGQGHTTPQATAPDSASPRAASTQAASAPAATAQSASPQAASPQAASDQVASAQGASSRAGSSPQNAAPQPASSEPDRPRTAPAAGAPTPAPRPAPSPGPGTPTGAARPASGPATPATGPGNGTPAGSGPAGDPAAAPTRPTRAAGAAPTTIPAPADDGPTVAMRAPAPAAPPSTTGAPGTGWDSEATQVIPLRGAPAPTSSTAAAPAPGTGGDSPTELIPAVSGGTPPTPPEDDRPTGVGRRPRRRALLIVAAVVAVLALVYVADLLFSSGTVPRGTTVAGVAVGGLSLADAEQQLRTEIEPRSTVPVQVRVGEVTSEIDPTVAGLTVDWQGTLERAGEQPLNPIERLTSLFTSREIGVVTDADDEAVAASLAEIAPIVDREPVEGTVRFEGTTPIAVDPVAGQRLDQPAAVTVLERDWASGVPVDLPLVPLPAVSTPEDVAAAIDQVARPAVSEPVTVLGEGGTRGTLAPEDIAAALSFTADPAGNGLVPALNPTVITDALSPQLAASERPARDASLDFSSGTPVVVPSQDGRGVDYEATLADLLDVLTGTGPREITAVYADKPADLTTEEAGALGNAGVIGEFQTGGFAADSGQNIRRAAEAINGTVVEPGETFSLNAATAPRTAAGGYVEAGIISEGHPSRGVGGGVSQVATTLFNAAYLAGMTDIEHKEHSFYISRYPAGREATVFDDLIDLKFRNDNTTPVLIQTSWTPSSITIRILGTRQFEVTGSSGPRTNPTSPNTVTIPAGEPCSPSQGAPGFTIVDTRTLRDVTTGETTSDSRTVRYNPSPIVVCGG